MQGLQKLQYGKTLFINNSRIAGFATFANVAI